MTEKTIILSSYDGATKVRFGGKEYPIESVHGFRLDENGEIAWISLDTEILNNSCRFSRPKRGIMKKYIWLVLACITGLMGIYYLIIADPAQVDKAALYLAIAAIQHSNYLEASKVDKDDRQPT